jgi:mRNA interferase RelE/StbE
VRWAVEYLPEAEADLSALGRAVAVQVLKGIAKVSANPVARSEGGYGEPLGNRPRQKLAGLFKIKFLRVGVRAVYALRREGRRMIVVVVAAREDGAVYAEAAKRRTRTGL